MNWNLDALDFQKCLLIHIGIRRDCEEYTNYYKSKAYRDTVDSYNKPSGIHRCSPSIQVALSI